MSNDAQYKNRRTITEHTALTAHDLRIIISNIYGLNQLLSDKLEGQTDPEIQEYTGLINSQCELAVDFTEGLVLLYQQSNFSLNNLLTELQQTYRHRADSKDIRLTISLPDKVIHVQAERAKLIRVLDNLLDNAVKFSPRKGHVNISLSLIAKESKAIISISDTGIGIPDSYHSVLFNKHPKIQREGTENEPSTGLGLYIARKLTEELNGQLWFDSTENNGTTFYLSLDVTLGQ